MSNPLSDMAYNLLCVFKDVVKNRQSQIQKLSAFANEFDMTVDVVNNRLYGRVEIDDRFLKTAFGWLAENTPDLAARFLRHYFQCQKISLGDEDPPKPINADDLHLLIMRIAKNVGDVAGAHAESMTNGQLELFEIDRELKLVQIAKDYLAQYEATLLRTQADIISESRGKKSSPKRNNGNGKVINDN